MNALTQTARKEKTNRLFQQVKDAHDQYNATPSKITQQRYLQAVAAYNNSLSSTQGRSPKQEDDNLKIMRNALILAVAIIVGWYLFAGGK